MIIEQFNETNTRVTHYSDLGYTIRQVETGNIYGSAEDIVPCSYTYEETGEKFNNASLNYACWLAPDGHDVPLNNKIHYEVAREIAPHQPNARNYLLREGWLRVTWRHGAPEWKAIGVRQNTESGISAAQAQKLEEWGISNIILYDTADHVR